MTPTTASPTVEPTQPCVRCGRPVALDIALCEFCNPLDLAQPAASQAHGIAFLGIAGAVLALALIGRLSLAGIGPFQAEVVGAVPAAGGLSLTLTVTNGGNRAGASTCRVARIGGAGPGSEAVAMVLTPDIEPGATLSFSQVVTVFGTEALAAGGLGVQCASP